MEILNRFFSDYTEIHPFIPVFIFLLVVAAFGVGTLLIASLIRPNRPDPEKLSPYECGPRRSAADETGSAATRHRERES